MRAALTGLLLASALAAHGASPVAFVADIRGNATIEGNGRLAFLAELRQGTRLLLGSGSMAAVTFAATGAEFTISGPGEFVVTAVEVKAEKGPPATRRTVASLPEPSVIARVSQTATASLRMRSVSPVSSPRIGALEYPVQTRVATLHPVHRWRGDSSDAMAHTLTITDASGKEIWKGSAKPGGTQAGVRLAPETRYSWSVTSSAGSLGEGGYQTLSSNAIAQVERSRAGALSFPERVVHALLLQGLGADQDARAAWAELARERPDLTGAAALAR